MTNRHEVLSPYSRQHYSHPRLAAEAAIKREFAIVLFDGVLVAAVAGGKVYIPAGETNEHFAPLEGVRNTTKEPK